MSINVVARKFLWGRAGNQCAWSDCTQSLTAVAGDAEAGVLKSQGMVIGEEAHIRSSKPDGPRYDPSFPTELIDAYENLILLCPTHHTVIDKDNGDGWPTDAVLQMKRDHEMRLESSRRPHDTQRLRLEERLAAQVATWERQLGIDTEGDWDGLTFGLNFPIPMIEPERIKRLTELGHWLLRRSWPPEYPRVKLAFARHFSVVQTLLSVLGDVMVRSDHRWELDRPYKRLGRWDPAEYERLLRETNLRATTIWFLTTELARSANLVITAVRDEIDPLYRFDEGIVLTRDGDGILVNQVIRDEYAEWKWESPTRFPTIKEIRDAIESAAAPNDSRLQGIDPRAIVPSTHEP